MLFLAKNILLLTRSKLEENEYGDLLEFHGTFNEKKKSYVNTYIKYAYGFYIHKNTLNLFSSLKPQRSSSWEILTFSSYWVDLLQGKLEET